MYVLRYLGDSRISKKHAHLGTLGYSISQPSVSKFLRFRRRKITPENDNMMIDVLKEHPPLSLPRLLSISAQRVVVQTTKTVQEGTDRTFFFRTS